MDASKRENKPAAPEEITPEMRAKFDEFAERGNHLEDEGRYEEAIETWQEGLQLIPEPRQWYCETIWFLAAIGDVYFQRNEYAKARECFDQARGNLSGAGYRNPFIMLRLGQCCLETGDEKNAVEYLLRAYMMEGKKLFEPDENGNEDGRSYFEYLRTHVDAIE